MPEGSELFTTVKLQRASHGCHFRAYTLRGAAKLIDPFLSVDHAWMSAPTFPLHPHAGFSAVSYLFLDSETGIRNLDSLGSSNLIQPGGLHWAMAGSGIVHEEVPAQNGKTVHSLQLFIDLASELQNIDPFALSLEAQDVPVVFLPGIKIRVPLGSYQDTHSPISPPTAVTMLDLSLEDSAELLLPVLTGQSAFILPIFGAVTVDGQRFDREELCIPVFTCHDSPREITLKAQQGAAKAVFFCGRPLHF